MTPLFGEPGQSGFERSAAGVVIYECGVDAKRVADPEGLEVGFERVANEGGGRTLPRREDGQ